MKILAIRLENLASLAGRHEIDFTAPPLAEQGLFAITGPTGAGKSTLLDALCLALYGSTPRLRHAPGRDSQLPDVAGEALSTADARTLLRRGCASGYAEVDFIGRDQRHYRARWAVRRARDRHDGRLQAAEQSLTDLDDQRLLTTQKREFDRLLPERLGLTFEQFTRAVLLAQSEFATFLKADDNARSELLEKLTDTGVYSRISIVAYRRAREAQQVVRDLEQHLTGDAPAEAEQRAQLESEATNSARELATAQADSARLQSERQWLQQEQRLSQAMQEAIRRQGQAQRDDEALEAVRQREQDLETLAPQRHRFLRQATLEQQLLEAEQRLVVSHKSLTDAEQQRDATYQIQKKADDVLAQASLDRQQTLPLIDAAREQATQLDHLLSNHNDKQAKHKQVAGTLANEQRRLERLCASRQQQQGELEQLEKTLRDQLAGHADALAARRALQASEEQAGQRRLALQTLQQYWQQWRDGERQLNALRGQYRSDERQQSEVLAQGRLAAAELDRLSRQQQALQTSIERLRAARSKSVQRLREQLEEAQPCPVCGSLDHPYRKRSPSEPAEALLEATEREEQQQLDEAAKVVDAARERHHALQGEYRALKARLEQHASQIALLTDHVAAQRGQLLEQPQGHALLEHGLDQHDLNQGTGSPENTETSTAENTQRWLNDQRELAEQQYRQSRQALERLESLQQRLEPLKQTLQQHEIEREGLASRCEQHRLNLESLDAELAPLAERCERLTLELDKALGNFDTPHAWQIAVDNRLDEARSEAQQTQTRVQQAISEVQRRQQAAHYQQQELDTLRQEQATLSDNLNRWRATHPRFDDTALAALLTIDDQDRQTQRQRLQEAERERHAADVSLHERRQALMAHRHERFSGELERLEADSLLSERVDNRIAELQARIDSQEATLTERCRIAQQQRDIAMHALHDDDRRRERQRHLLDELERARREQHRWGSISELIGSADGKTFRRIAQAYNLEQLLDHANAHLASLSRRYRLARGASELGILVIDGDMGDERRSVHSLSGGETFLVSLALALGLASMASGQLRIESLFIDEGFGSLDPQSLALAMEALEGLQAQGRRVGVISHIQEMHERIPLQIRVEPAGNGASRVSVVPPSRK